MLREGEAHHRVRREGAQSGSPAPPGHDSVARSRNAGCRAIALHATEKGSVCSWHIFHLEEMGLVGWASNYASPGLLFCVDEVPAPRHLQGRHAGGYKLLLPKDRENQPTRKPANAMVRTPKPNRNPNRTSFHLVTGLQHVEGSSNSRYQVVLAKDPSYFPKTQPGPKCSSTDVEPAAPETQPLQLAHKVKDVEPIAMHAGD